MCSPRKISIVVPTHKGRDLSLLKKSIENCNYADYELIIVDEGKERSAQRNIGAGRATGDFLLFLDSDMTIHPSLLNECASIMDCFDGLYIPEVIVGHPIKTFFRSFYNETRVDAIRFIKKDKFIEFDENITGFEDWDFDRRFNGRKGITALPLYHHSEGGIKKKAAYLYWMSIYKKKYPRCPELSLRYRLWTVFTEKGKWKKLLSLPRFLLLTVVGQRHSPKI